VRAAATALLGADRSVVAREPLMGAEDFAYVLEQVPGAMAFLGACPPGEDPASAAGNHSNLVVFDEDVLPDGAALYAAMALAALAA
jgi:metal-dependent amidase/aminoacylase/carboxypeptidase family protein